MISEREAEVIGGKFLDAMPDDRDHSAESARKLLGAWDYLWEFMKREHNFSDRQDSKILDCQIGNWANDTALTLHNAKLYEEEIRVNEQILKMKWHNSSSLFHENAKRDIADAYADMGNIQKCYELYDEYLKEDPLWGWAWIGYYRQLHDHDDERFEKVLDDLYQKVRGGTDFRDQEDLYRELGDEYSALGHL